MNDLSKYFSLRKRSTVRKVAYSRAAIATLLGCFIGGVLSTSVAFAQEKTRINTLSAGEKNAGPGSTVTGYQANDHDPGETYPGQPRGNLDIRITNGESVGYAFIKQILPLQEGVRELPYVVVEVTPEEMWQPYYDWEWEVKSPNNNQLESDLTFDWYGQASCPGSLTSLTVSGPGGSLSQSPLTNPVWGYFKYQSFDVDTAKNICLEWAEAGNCDFIVPGKGCPVYETFIVTGGSMQAPNDRLRLKASCNTGPVADEYIAPKMELRCIKVQ